MVRRMLAVVALATTFVTLASSPALAEPSVSRLAGTNRYETSARVAQFLHAGPVETVVIATGAGYADALAAGVAAASLDAPLLLAAPGAVPVEALQELDPESVLLIGGTGAIPPVVEAAIAYSTGAAVERVAGTDRFETARLVGDRTAPFAVHTFVASGESFDTALVAATHAARERGRLELSRTLPAGVVEVDGNPIEGGAPVVNRELLERFPTTSPTAVVATLDAFPDALSATALAAAMDAPVLFTRSSSAGTTTFDVFNVLDPTQLLVVGGTAAVPDAVLHQLFGWLPLPPDVDPAAASRIARDVFERANAERAARGVAPLLWDDALAAEASSWAREMSRTGYRQPALSPGIGQNIHQAIPYCAGATCSMPTSGVPHRDWMRSAGHRDNIVEPGYATVGIGAFCAPDGTLWTVERFAVAFSGVSSGGTAPTPIAHDTTSGVTCEGEVVGDQPWWPAG